MKRAGSILADISSSMKHLGGMPCGPIFRDIQDPIEVGMKKHHSEDEAALILDALSAAEDCIKIGHGGAQKDNGCNKCEALLKIAKVKKALSK